MQTRNVARITILLIAAVIINFQDGQGGQHTEPGLVQVPRDVGQQLVGQGLALYTQRADDPSRSGAHTATDRELAAAELMAKAQAKKTAADSEPIA